MVGTDPPFDNCDTTNGIEIFVDSTATVGNDYDIMTSLDWQPEVTHSYRVVFASTYSMATDGSNQVIDEFDVTFLYESCTDLTVATTPDDWIYEVGTGSTAKTFTPTWSADQTACSYPTYWRGWLETTGTQDFPSFTGTTLIKSETTPIDWATLGFSVTTVTDTDDTLSLTLDDRSTLLTYTTGLSDYPTESTVTFVIMFYKGETSETGSNGPALGEIGASNTFRITLKDKCVDDVPSLTAGVVQSLSTDSFVATTPTIAATFLYPDTNSVIQAKFTPTFAHSGHSTDCAYTTTIKIKNADEPDDQAETILVAGAAAPFTWVTRESTTVANAILNDDTNILSNCAVGTCTGDYVISWEYTITTSTDADFPQTLATSMDLTIIIA